MEKRRININSIHNLIYNNLKLKRKYKTAPNEKIPQTKIVFNLM
jgi:hypothetical protein